MKGKQNDPLYARIRDILESAKSNVARSVNTTQVIANWLIGREIVEEEQKGRERADYGTRLLTDLARRLTIEFGRGFSKNNLEHFRNLYLTFPNLVSAVIPHAARAELEMEPVSEIPHALRGELDVVRISNAARQKSWKPGLLNPNLSWTHYRTLLRVEKPQGRAFYEIEAIKNNWSARELERQRRENPGIIFWPPQVRGICDESIRFLFQRLPTAEPWAFRGNKYAELQSAAAALWL